MIIAFFYLIAIMFLVFGAFCQWQTAKAFNLFLDILAELRKERR